MVRSHAFIAVCLAVATLVVSALISALRPPVPRVHDEFAYLLAADTFSHGRLTNPTPDLWRHFETMHVIYEPSYASKYPPGQGLMLALGQVLTGWPIVGVWITSALAVVAGYWMLLGVVPPKWATIGATTLIVHPGFQLTWGQSYWGGTLAFVGGALAIGAALRMTRIGEPLRVRDAVLMSLGALTLAVTRPFEGLIVCVLVAVWLLVSWTRQGWPRLSALATRFLLPQVLVLSVGLGLMAFYNNAVTGDPWRMPYQVHEQTYGMCPLFLFGTPHAEHDYAHDALRKYHAEWSMKWFDRQQTPWGLLQTKGEFLEYCLMVLLPLPLLGPVLLLPWWRGRRLRWPLFVLAGTWLVTQLAIWNWPHYLAPIAPVVLLLAVYGLRNLRMVERRYGWRVDLAKTLILLQAACFVWAVNTWVTKPAGGWQWYRAAMQEHLEHEPGKHLVFIDYTPHHYPHEEWVYNAADIEGAKVVWARSMSREENAELIQHYPNRTVWHVAADLRQPWLAPYQHPTPQQFANAADTP